MKRFSPAQAQAPILNERKRDMIPPLPDQHYYFDWVDTASARGKPTTSLTVYECVLRSHVFLEILTAGAHAKNRACLEKAVELDPGYVEAWAWLVSQYGEEYIFGFNTKPNAMERALETARRAVMLDGTNQTARHILAWLLFSSAIWSYSGSRPISPSPLTPTIP